MNIEPPSPSSRIRKTLLGLATTCLIATSLAGASAAHAQNNAPIQITVQNSGYEQWGRPVGMDDGTGDCNLFDNSRPMSKFNVSVQVKNNTDKPMANWGAKVLKNNSNLAFVCYYVQNGDISTIAPGQAVNVTFSAFMDRGETAKQLVIIDDEIGQAAPINFNAAGKPTGTGKLEPTPRPGATPRATNNILVTLQNTGYEQWGRPVGMDNSKAGCSEFDNSRPVSKYNVSLQVKNNAKQDMTDWYATVLKNNGNGAFVCYYIQEGGLPNVPAGGLVNVTFAAFMEPGEKAAKLIVHDKSVGRSKEIALP